MSNAAKLKKKAAEFEQKKQFDKALQIYIQILDEGDDEEAEGDVALYNRVGDLLMRQGSIGDAMTYYEKAVDLYAESGFFNNAIALCNKILRQSPGRNLVYYKLGKISAKKGFISDAKQNFLEYASRMQSGGHLDEAFRALKEFADLCPDQDDIRLMLAEQLSKKDRKKEALEQLQLLYQKFEAEGRGEDMRATVSRMRSIDPSAEPKTGSTVRNQKSSDLVFLDLGDGHAKPPGSRVPGEKARAAVPPRRSGEARKTVPVAAEPEPEPAEVVVDLPQADTLAVEDDDLLPLPSLDESQQAVEGFESDSQRADDTAAEGSRLSGYEPSALEDELSQALDAALPDVEPPLSGQEFAALRLSTPLSVPIVEPPEHDLALPGELPPIGHGGRSVLSLTDEMDLIIPDSEDSLPQQTPAGRSSSQKPSRDEPPTDGISLTGVDSSPAKPPGPPSARGDGLSLVGGADLLDVPDVSGDAENRGSSLPSSPLPPPREGFGKRRSSRALTAPPQDAVELAGWLDDSGRDPAAANGSVMGTAPSELPLLSLPEIRRRSEGSHSALARSVDALRLRVESDPANWELRRRLAEALLDAGDREAGLQVLETAMVGLERSQDLEGARSVADEIIRLIPNSVRHHQKRVEYAFRTSDRSRLPQAYLELADALFRSGQADKARAVYQRVLELSPDDPRAQAALSTFGEEFLELLPLDADALESEPEEETPEAEPPARPPLAAGGLPTKAGGLGPAAAPGPRLDRVPPGRSAPQPPPAKPEGRLEGRGNRSEPRSGQRAGPLKDSLTEQKPAGKGESKLPGRLGLRPPERQEPKSASPQDSRPELPAGSRAAGQQKGGAAAQRAGRGAPAAQGGQDTNPPGESASSRDNFVNLGDWLRDDEGPRSTRLVVEEENPTGDEQADFADMLRKFKQGIAENVSDEDHESHYDLGVAYKEMGLVDEAIAEFQKALRGDHRVRTYEALGQCFIEKEQFMVAATILGRALTEPAVTDDQLVGVLYLLGYASEALMRWEAAVGYYQRVFAVDIRFRDAAERLAALERTPR